MLLREGTINFAYLARDDPSDSATIGESSLSSAVYIQHSVVLQSNSL